MELIPCGVDDLHPLKLAYFRAMHVIGGVNYCCHCLYYANLASYLSWASALAIYNLESGDDSSDTGTRTSVTLDDGMIPTVLRNCLVGLDLYGKFDQLFWRIGIFYAVDIIWIGWSQRSLPISKSKDFIDEIHCYLQWRLAIIDYILTLLLAPVLKKCSPTVEQGTLPVPEKDVEDEYLSGGPRIINWRRGHELCDPCGTDIGSSSEN